MTEKEHEAIVRNTLPIRADVSSSWAQDLGMAKGVVELSVSAAIEAHRAPAGDEDPPLTEAQAVKAASDVAAFFGDEGDDRPAADASLSDVDRDVLRYFGCEREQE